MKHLFITLVLMLSAALSATAQTEILGTVVEKDSGKALPGASVVIKNAEGKIKKFASTKPDGSFKIIIDTNDGMTLEVSMISFAKQSISLVGAHFPIKIMLEPEALVLKEVAVKSDKIREQGDTITYSVGSFAQAQDRSIGDVLRRMPGINVNKSGEIKYQGESINKFYIEGSDLLGGKYGIATQGIRHDDVGAVEVMENHQPLQVLSGISFSDKAAINLKLKNKAKATWSVHGNAGLGYSAQPEGLLWDGQIFAMAIMSSFQNITTFRSNNTGEDLSWQSRDFFSGRRSTGLTNQVSLSLPGVPSLNSRRTLFNRSALVSTNNLWKQNNGEFKAQIDYSFNRVTASAANITTYFLNDGDRIVTEDRDGTEHSHALSAKFTYELNKRTAFINNSLKTNINWNDIDIRATGSLPNTQNASLPDYYINNDFKIIKRFKDKHLVTFKSTNEWESMPQTLTVRTADRNSRQHVGEHAFYTSESAAYTFVIKGISLSLEAGIKGYIRSMDSKADELPDILQDPETLSNVVNTNYVTIFATPKFEYWLDRVNFTLSLPLNYSYYRFDKAIANRSEGYFSPTLAMSWKPNNRFTVYLRGGLGRAPMNLNMVQPGFIMTDYRSFRQGVDNFYNTSSQNVSASISYKHTRLGLFANGLVMHSWSHVPYTMVQQLYGNYIVYSYADAESSGKRLMTGADIGKTLDLLRGSINVKAGFSRNESRLISSSEPVSSVGTSWNIGISLNTNPVRWFNIDYSFDFAASNLAMNGLRADWLSSMENSLSLNILPHRKWEWNIAGEHYRNEISADRYKNALLLNTKLLFKLSKRLEISACLNNIFDRRSYNYTTYSTISSFESQRLLRGREFLISISLKK